MLTSFSAILLAGTKLYCNLYWTQGYLGEKQKIFMRQLFHIFMMNHKLLATSNKCISIINNNNNRYHKAIIVHGLLSRASTTA